MYQKRDRQRHLHELHQPQSYKQYRDEHVGDDVVIDTAPMNVCNATARRSTGGFTLVEMSMSMAILTLLTVGIFNVFWQALKAYNETSLMSVTAVQASFALDRMV